jgi:heat shock protein HslJ
VNRTARRPFRCLFLLPAVVVLVGLAACGETPEGSRSATAGLPDLEQSLTAAEWLLDPGDSSVSGSGADTVTLVFTGATEVSGSGPCNRYRGTVALDGDDGVRLGGISATRMGCEPEVMAAEQEYFAALEEVRTADTTDRDRLVLSAEGVRLSFTAIDPRELVVGEWAITAVRSGDAVRSVVDGTGPVARFAADDALVVETGCNTLRGSWRFEGRDLVVEQVATTLVECVAPAGVMEQEAGIVAALTSASRAEVRPGQLSLLDGSGDVVLTAVAGR